MLLLNNFFNDIDFKNVKSDLELIITILYEGYKADRYGGSSTRGIYLCLIINTNDDFIFLILQNIKRQLSNLKLDFKCIIKCTIKAASA